MFLFFLFILFLLLFISSDLLFLKLLLFLISFFGSIGFPLFRIQQLLFSLLSSSTSTVMKSVYRTLLFFKSIFLNLCSNLQWPVSSQLKISNDLNDCFYTLNKLEFWYHIFNVNNNFHKVDYVQDIRKVSC